MNDNWFLEIDSKLLDIQWLIYMKQNHGELHDLNREDRIVLERAIAALEHHYQFLLHLSLINFN